MNHIILADGTMLNTSQESGSTFRIPLEGRDAFKDLLSKITDENVQTIQIVTEEDVVIERLSNLTLSRLSLEQADDGGTYMAVLECRPADKTAQRLADQQTSIDDLATAVAGLLYGEDGETE